MESALDTQFRVKVEASDVERKIVQNIADLNEVVFVLSDGSHVTNRDVWRYQYSDPFESDYAGYYQCSVSDEWIFSVPLLKADLEQRIESGNFNNFEGLIDWEGDYEF